MGKYLEYPFYYIMFSLLDKYWGYSFSYDPCHGIGGLECFSKSTFRQGTKSWRVPHWIILRIMGCHKRRCHLHGVSTHTNGSMHIGINSTFLILIPKVSYPLYFDHYLPISLYNYIYNIFYGVLDSRIKPILSQHISK